MRRFEEQVELFANVLHLPDSQSGAPSGKYSCPEFLNASGEKGEKVDASSSIDIRGIEHEIGDCNSGIWKLGDDPHSTNGHD